MTNQITLKQRRYIAHLVDTREAPQVDPSTGETPGIGEWHSAEDLAHTGRSTRTTCTSRQASNLIDWLLARPAKSTTSKEKTP